MSRKKTLRDIALTAGVSPSTVTRALAGVGSSQIRERVRKAALKLGINPNDKVKSKILAFILSNRSVLHPFHSRVLAGAEAFCVEQGFDVLLILSYRYEMSSRWNELVLPQTLRRRNLVRGVILAGTNSPDLMTLLRKKGFPFAVFGNNVLGEWESKDYDVVWYDDIQGSYEMTRYLRALGHSDIWFAGNLQFPWDARCAGGYRRAMEEANLPPRCGDIPSDDRQQVGYLAAKSILSQHEPVSAIFAADAQVARGIYKALMEFGRSVPEDVSVVGTGDLDATMMNPRLTAYQVFPEQLGAHLAKMVIERIASPDLPTRQITVPSELVKRESCRSLSAQVASLA